MEVVAGIDVGKDSLEVRVDDGHPRNVSIIQLPTSASWWIGLEGP